MNKLAKHFYRGARNVALALGVSTGASATPPWFLGFPNDSSPPPSISLQEDTPGVDITVRAFHQFSNPTGSKFLTLEGPQGSYLQSQVVGEVDLNPAPHIFTRAEVLGFSGSAIDVTLPDNFSGPVPLTIRAVDGGTLDPQTQEVVLDPTGEFAELTDIWNVVPVLDGADVTLDDTTGNILELVELPLTITMLDDDGSEEVVESRLSGIPVDMFITLTDLAGNPVGTTNIQQNGELTLTKEETEMLMLPDGMPGKLFCAVKFIPGVAQLNFAVDVQEQSDPGNIVTTSDNAQATFVTGCTDGIDNNGNGLIDSADPGCVGIQDVSEKPGSQPCGNGFQQAVMMLAIPLTAGAVRRRLKFDGGQGGNAPKGPAPV